MASRSSELNCFSKLNLKLRNLKADIHKCIMKKILFKSKMLICLHESKFENAG